MSSTPVSVGFVFVLYLNLVPFLLCLGERCVSLHHKNIILLVSDLIILPPPPHSSPI